MKIVISKNNQYMEPVVEFPVHVERCCGLDVHQQTVVATIRGTGLIECTRTYSTFTQDLEALSNWLESLGVTDVAMESTGIYWKPVYNILDLRFRVILVNARHIKNVPGHKTDKKDSVWIAKLLASGLLKASFIPQQPVRELRELNRYKKKLVNQRVGHVNRLHKILQDANIKLASVVSDVRGVSASAMIEAIIQGIDTPEELVLLAKGSLKHKREQLVKALTGRLSDHHRFMLSTIKNAILEVDHQIEAIQARIDLYKKEQQETVDHLCTIPGVSEKIAMNILGEVGPTVASFPNEHHLASWAGVCPGNNESAGKKKNERTVKGNKLLKTTLVEAAWAAVHTKNTFYQRKYQALIVRKGPKKAIVAIAHKIIKAVYFILRDQCVYKEINLDRWETRKRQTLEAYYHKRLNELSH